MIKSFWIKIETNPVQGLFVMVCGIPKISCPFSHVF